MGTAYSVLPQTLFVNVPGVLSHQAGRQLSGHLKQHAVYDHGHDHAWDEMWRDTLTPISITRLHVGTGPVSGFSSRFA